MSSNRFREYDGDMPRGCHHDDPENYDSIECEHCETAYCEVCDLGCQFCHACPGCDAVVELPLPTGPMRVCGRCLCDEAARGRVWFCDTHDELHLMATDAETPFMMGHALCAVSNSLRGVRWRAQQKYPTLCKSRPWMIVSPEEGGL